MSTLAGTAVLVVDDDPSHGRAEAQVPASIARESRCSRREGHVTGGGERSRQLTPWVEMRYANRTSLSSGRHATPPSLYTSLHRVLASGSWRALALVDALLLAQGPIGSASHVAWCLGLRSRFELANWLTREGLPPLHELAGWVSVLVWADLSVRTPTSLCVLAVRSGRDPAACYRLVQRMTGRCWSTVRALGVEWVLSGLAARCQAVRKPSWEAVLANRAPELISS